MSYLTVEMINKLRNAGFSFPQMEENLCNPGNVFFYEDCEYVIGGKCDGSPLSAFDLKAAQEGIWLPNTDDLMLWIQWKADKDVSISYDNEKMYFYGEARGKDGKVYTGSGPDLLCCLYKLALKICKNK